VTERTAYILKVRKLAVALATAWLEPAPAREARDGS
jgi:glycyl-tRNA synthetase alpha subunit